MTIQIGWTSDLHLNLAKQEKIDRFCNSIVEKYLDGLIITGDISESHLLHQHLDYIGSKIQDIPIYFIYGNHDVYKSSIETVNTKLSEFLKTTPNTNLIWMTQAGIIKLTDKTCLIGGENWWDGGYGDIKTQGIFQELIMIQDYTSIADISIKKNMRPEKLKEISEKFLEHFKTLLPQALEQYDDVILMTHVPPFKESCSYQSMPLQDQWLFHFCCRGMGEFLYETMKQYKNKTLTVLSGHTHTAHFARIAPNLTSIVAAASYFSPKIFTTISID